MNRSVSPISLSIGHERTIPTLAMRRYSSKSSGEKNAIGFFAQTMGHVAYEARALARRERGLPSA
jgi:hypothetical protein